MRDASTAHQAQRSPALWADLDAAATLQLLDAAGSDTLIHGHTHRPGRVLMSPTAVRHVLSDWDFDGDTPRGRRDPTHRAGLANGTRDRTRLGATVIGGWIARLRARRVQRIVQRRAISDPLWYDTLASLPFLAAGAMPTWPTCVDWRACSSMRREFSGAGGPQQ